MPDYQQAKIYKLTCDNPDLVYYGSTTKKYLSSRLALHKCRPLKCCIPLLEAGNVKIELVEKFPCNCVNELNRKEGEYIKNNNCVNKQIAGRSKREYQRIYENTEVICECGCKSKRANLRRHMKSEKHKKLLIKNAEQAGDSSGQN